VLHLSQALLSHSITLREDQTKMSLRTRIKIPQFCGRIKVIQGFGKTQGRANDDNLYALKLPVI